MAINLTITVSEDLHKRLQKVKKNFKVSQVCQEAIQTEVKRQELLKSGLDNMKDVIERLRLEKAEIAKTSYDEGYKEGLGYFKSVPYEALAIIDEHRNDPLEVSLGCLEKELDWGLYLHGLFSEDDDESREDLQRQGYDAWLFAEGFFKAIVDCCDNIKEQL